MMQLQIQRYLSVSAELDTPSDIPGGAVMGLQEDPIRGILFGDARI